MVRSVQSDLCLQLCLLQKRYFQLGREALAIIFGVKRFHQYLFGREFELKTDHKWLIYFFSEKVILTLASGCVQRWALALEAYRYSIQYCQWEDNVTADAVSRLPIETTPLDPPIPCEVIHLMEYLDASPTTSAQIETWTNHDPVLSKVREWLLSSWPSQESGEDSFKPYERRRYELSVEEGCILWGSRVVMPPEGRKSIVYKDVA